MYLCLSWLLAAFSSAALMWPSSMSRILAFSLFKGKPLFCPVDPLEVKRSTGDALAARFLTVEYAVDAPQRSRHSSRHNIWHIPHLIMLHPLLIFALTPTHVCLGIAGHRHRPFALFSDCPTRYLSSQHTRNCPLHRAGVGRLPEPPQVCCPRLPRTLDTLAFPSSRYTPFR